MTNLSISQLIFLWKVENPNESDLPLENISGDKSGEKQNIGKWEKNICYFCHTEQANIHLFFHPDKQGKSKNWKMSNEQTVTTNIKTSDDDLEILKKHFPQCFDKNGNFQFEKFKN